MTFFVQFLVLSLFVSCAQLKLTAPEKKVEHFRMSWAKSLDGVYDSGNLPVTNGAPSYRDGLVYFGDLQGVLHTYSLEDGRELWAIKHDQELGAPGLFFEDQIIYGSYFGRLYSRHYLTGKEKYEVELGYPLESRPVLDQGKIYLHLRNHQIMSLDALTGKILWSYKRNVAFTTTIQTISLPLIDKDRLYVGFADGYLVAMNKEDGAVIWEKSIGVGPRFIDVDTTPILLNNGLYAGPISGPYARFNKDTGAQELSFDFTLSHAPFELKTGNETRMVAGTTEGEIIIFGSDNKVLLRKKISTRGISSIQLWKKNLVASTLAGELILLNPENFSIIETYALGSRYSSVMSDMIVTENEKLIVFSARNRLYVFE